MGLTRLYILYKALSFSRFLKQQPIEIPAFAPVLPSHHYFFTWLEDQVSFSIVSPSKEAPFVVTLRD